MAKITIKPINPDNNAVISIKSASYIRKAKFWKRSFIVSLIINIGLAIRIILTTITV